MALKRDNVTVGDCEVSMLRGGRGSPILILHGAGGNASVRALAETLSERHDVLLPDHPGFGESDGPDWIVSMSDLAFFYLDLMDQLDVRDVHLIGHSMGGWLASEIAIRSTARLKSATLVAAAGLYVRGKPYGDIFLMTPEELTRSLYATDAAIQTALAYQPSDNELSVIARNRVAAARYAWSPRLHNPDLGKWLHRIDVPAQLVWGADDKIVPVEYGREFKRLMPQAPLVVYERCGHQPQVEQRDAFLAQIDTFISEAEA